MVSPAQKCSNRKKVVVWGFVALFSYILWVHVFWGFHHEYALGLFGWLLIGSEEGVSIIPNPCTLPVTFALWSGVVWQAYKRTHREPATPLTRTKPSQSTQDPSTT